MEILLSVAIFVIILFLLEASYSVFKGKDKRSVQMAAKKYTVTPITETEIDILYRRKLSDVPPLNWLLGRFKIFSRIDMFLQQSGTNMLVGVYLLLSFGLGTFGFLVPILLNKSRTSSIVYSVLAAIMPTLFIIIKRKQRSAKFERLFPEALDLLGYSLRAGHSIMTGMKMVADEISDPVGREFGRVVEEVNFGRGLNSALYAFRKD